MISQNPDLMFLIVWSVALTSIVGAMICFSITPMLARLTRIPFALIAAPLVLIMVVGAYQATSTMGDIFMLFSLGAVGWLMKHAGWPRAPALVGFVLASPMEQYFWLTNQLHGWSWLMRPGVLIIASIIIVPMMFSLFRRVRGTTATDDSVALKSGANDLSRQRAVSMSAGASDAEAVAEFPVSDASRVTPEPNNTIELCMAVLATVVFAYALWAMQVFNPTSRAMPLLAVVPGLPLAFWLFVKSLKEYQIPTTRDYAEPLTMLVLISYAFAVWAIGLSVPTIVLIYWMLIVKARMRLWRAVMYGTVIFALTFWLFSALRGDAPTGALLNVGWPL